MNFYFIVFAFNLNTNSIFIGVQSHTHAQCTHILIKICAANAIQMSIQTQRKMENRERKSSNSCGN